MNQLLTKLERKLGRFAIPNLTMYILAGYAVGYVLYYMKPEFYMLLLMDARAVMHGEIWRIFTWVCTIPQDFSIFLIFFFFLSYWMGTSLERTWGVFRYNLYVFSGMLFMVAGTLGIYLITGINISISTYYIYVASFLAFATCFPDIQLYVMMLIPVKIKWLAIVDVIWLAYDFLSVGEILREPSQYGVSAVVARNYVWGIRASIVFSVLNFIIFYFATRNYKRLSPKEYKRKKKYIRQVQMANPIREHKCAICGRTPESGEDLTFRFCSKCNGNYEYCQDHIFTHEHIK